MITWNVRKSVSAAMAIAAFWAINGEPVRAADEFVVSYRLTEWKAAHFDDAATAKSHYDAVRRLGCEAKEESHGGHHDVSFRSPKWRKILLKKDSEAHQWSKWLAANGFETMFVEPSHSDHLKTVRFRLTAWKSGHFNEASQAEEQGDTLKMLGCEVKLGSHTGHYDVSFRCPQRRTIGLESPDDAHKWEEWLRGSGFETVHEHRTARRR